VVVVISADLAHTHAHSVEGHATPFGVKDTAEVMDSTLEKWVFNYSRLLINVILLNFLKRQRHWTPTYST